MSDYELRRRAAFTQRVREHHCNHPRPNGLTIGQQWRCSGCGELWRLAQNRKWRSERDVHIGGRPLPNVSAHGAA